MNAKNCMLVFLALGALMARGAEDELAAWGGYIEVWPENPGQFAFVEAQSKASPKTIAQIERQVEEVFRIKFLKIRGSVPALTEVPAELKKLNAQGGIWFIDNPALPIAIAATENGWGFLNVGALAVDNPSAELLEKRLTKELNRLFVSIHGGIESITMPGCVTKPALGLNGLDALVCLQISPEAYGKVNGFLYKAGYKQLHAGSYYEACEEGWAPAPTNSVQKQIWDKVHALPKAPIKIKPETTKITK